ncbi:MAG: hypothetical protein RL088_596 [Verrucomicrobiota bacterium]|jgi:hypothetical protein
MRKGTRGHPLSQAEQKTNHTIAARKLLSRPPHRKRSEPGRASGSEGV